MVQNGARWGENVEYDTMIDSQTDRQAMHESIGSGAYVFAHAACAYTHTYIYT